MIMIKLFIILVKVEQSLMHPELSGCKYFEFPHLVQIVEELNKMQFGIVALPYIHFKLLEFVVSA